MKIEWNAATLRETLIAYNAHLIVCVVAVWTLGVLMTIHMSHQRFVQDVEQQQIFSARDLGLKPPDLDITKYESLVAEIVQPPALGGEVKRDILSMKQAAASVSDMKTCPDCGREIPKPALTCPFCSAPQYDVDTDKDGMPDVWENMYGFNPKDIADAAQDADNDGFSNLEEFRAGSDPKDPNSTPLTVAMVARYVVERIYRKPVDLLFKGYILLPGGEGYNFQINWAETTEFLKMKDKIRGYLIVDFVKKLEDEKHPDGTVGTKDLSTLTLRKGEDPEIVLQIGLVTIARERYADVLDKEENQRYTMYVGGTFKGYKVLDITNREVVICNNEGTVFRLTRQRR